MAGDAKLLKMLAKVAGGEVTPEEAAEALAGVEAPRDPDYVVAQIRKRNGPRVARRERVAKRIARLIGNGVKDPHVTPLNPGFFAVQRMRTGPHDKQSAEQRRQPRPTAK